MFPVLVFERLWIRIGITKSEENLKYFFVATSCCCNERLWIIKKIACYDNLKDITHSLKIASCRCRPQSAHVVGGIQLMFTCFCRPSMALSPSTSRAVTLCLGRLYRQGRLSMSNVRPSPYESLPDCFRVVTALVDLIDWLLN